MRKKLAMMPIAVASAVILTAMPAVSDPAEKPPAPAAATTFGFFSPQPLPNEMTVNEMTVRVDAGRLTVSGALPPELQKAMSRSTPLAAAATRDTPTGFRLINPGYRRTDYLYDSDKGAFGSTTCAKGKCKIDAQVSAQFRQQVVGMSSKKWYVTMTLKQVSNASGLTWT